MFTTCNVPLSCSPVLPRELNAVSIETGNHWSDYWQQGNLTSLPQGFAGNYVGEFLAYWEARFAGLQRGARVVDVCSGNGSIALLASDYSQRHGLDLRVSAADAAAIDPSRVLEAHPQYRQHLESIEFLPGVPLEGLAVETDSVDLVTSQYGVEYSHWETAAANIARMLRPGGHFCMVCHSPDSRILQEMESQHAAYAQIAAIPLLAQGDEANAGNSPPADLAARLENALAELYRVFQRNRSSQLLSAAGQRLEGIRKLVLQQADTGYREFLHFRESINTSYGITGDLVAVGRALRDAPRWHEVFVAAGLELIESGTVRYLGGEHAGDTHRFRKPD